MKRSTVLLLSGFIFFATVSFSYAEVKLPEIFASGMVLQRDKEVPVWGTANPGEEVSVAFDQQLKKATTDPQGHWMVMLDPLKAGGPFTLTVRGKNELIFDDILVGELWLCSGQSNMQWSMTASPDSRAEIPSVNNPKIRLFSVDRDWGQTPRQSFKASWQPCNPESVASFSAVGYYFGSELQSRLDVPVGLINASWGGTRIEPWTPPVGFADVSSLSDIVKMIEAKNPKTTLHKSLVSETLKQYREWIEKSRKNFESSKAIDPPPTYPDLLRPYVNHQQPTVLYNAMIHPLVPMALRGAIWYQGESNLSEGARYTDKMKALVQGWRNVFDNDDLAFYFVQLAPFEYKGAPTDSLPLFWEAQANAEKEIPNTGMAVINDIGNLRDIHPAHKKTVGGRLSLLALRKTYGLKDIRCDSPRAKSIATDGNMLTVRFEHAEELKTRDGKAPDWFEIAGANGIFCPAEAVIEGASIRLSSTKVPKPYLVRFAWSNLAEPNVQNEAGLQLGAFRMGEVPERELFESYVPEGKKFQVLYDFDPSRPVLTDGNRRYVYRIDRSGELAGKGKVKQVGYFLYLLPKEGDGRYIFVTMPPLDGDLAKLGVPTKASGSRFQESVTGVTVASNVSGIETGTFSEGCNVEFWDCNYGPLNETNVPGASSEIYDFGDQMSTSASPGYGSMQVHNHAKKQVLFAFNAFSKGANCDLGIGNCPSGSHTDWTFTGSAKQYDGARFMILVELEEE